MGVLLGIAQREKKHAPMEAISNAPVRFETGVGTDSRGKFKNHRQVTVLSKEGWTEASNEINTDMPWTTRRANLFVEGIDLVNSTDKKIVIGEVELLITGELIPCERMDAQCEGLTNALAPNWRGGVTCKLLREGEIKIGDSVNLLD